MSAERLQTQRIEVVAGTVNRCSFFPDDGRVWKLRYIKYMPDVSVTANDTNYVTMRAYKGDGTGTPIHAARSTTVAGTGFTRGTVLDYGVSTELPAPDVNFTASGADLEITDANPLTIQFSHTGSGAAAAFSILARFDVVRAAS